MDNQKLKDQILATIHKVESEADSLGKISRSAKSEYKKQKIEIENQFEMVTNLLKATQAQLLTRLEQKHKAQQQELNNKISKLNYFSKKYRNEFNETNKENITVMADMHDRIIEKFDEMKKSEKYIHKNIQVILDNSSILNNIQKIAYIQEKTEEEVQELKKFNFAENNKNLLVRPKIMALNTNSMNTKICVSWKLEAKRSDLLEKSIRKSQSSNGIIPATADFMEEDDAKNDNESNESEVDSPSPERIRRNSLSMTDEDVDTTNDYMNVHDIVSIDIEWRYSDDKEELTKTNVKKSGKKKEKYQWNVLDITAPKILAFELDTSIFDHILNTTRFGIFYFRISLYNRDSKIISKEMRITTFKVNVRHIADEWNENRKQRQVRLGYINKRIVTRDIPGKFRHIFGTLIVSKGVNVWTLKIKKHDANRQKCSAMIGVINMNNRNNDSRLKTLNQCFAHIGIGYGIFGANGDVYHTKNPRTFGKEIKEGDVVQIMVDYRGSTISFIVNNINWGIAFDRSHFPGGKMPHLGLCVALRGCDEIQIIDFVNEHGAVFPRQKMKRRRSSTSALPKRMSSSEKYGKLAPDFGDHQPKNDKE